MLFCFFYDEGCDIFNVYGIECNIFCFINCKDKMCNIENGNCFGCILGWIGIICIISKCYNDVICFVDVKFSY